VYNTVAGRGGLGELGSVTVTEPSTIVGVVNPKFCVPDAVPVGVKYAALFHVAVPVFVPLFEVGADE